MLVVEDEPLIRLDLAAILRSKDCKTLEASSAKEAIGILERSEGITVLFTDIQMPGEMDGVELAQYVRRRWPPIIVVVSSGKTRPQPGALARDIPFVGKPYDPTKLDGIISDIKTRLAAN